MIELTQYNIIPLISFILYAIILIIILSSNQTKLSRSFVGYIIAMMFWSIGSFLMKTNVPPSSLFWNKILQIGFVFVPVLLLRFSYILAGDYRTKKIVVYGYLISIVMVYLSFAEYVVTDATYVNGVFNYTPGFAAYVFAVIGLFYSSLALIVIIKKSIQKEISLKRIRLVLLGLVLVIIGGALNISPDIGAYGVDILFNTVNAILIMYSIYRNKFLEINLIVKRGLSFSFTSILLYFTYALIILYAEQFIRAYVEVESTISLIFIMMPFFLILEPIRNGLVKLSKRIFYRNTIDMNAALKEFSDLISTSLDLDKIGATLINAIQKAINSKEVYLILQNRKGYYLHQTSEQSKDKDIQLAFNHPIVKWFKNGNDILLKSQIHSHVMFKGIWKREREIIDAMHTEIIAPIRYQDELVGLVVIAERADENPYSIEETNFLQTIINNAAAIIENAKTIEAIKKQSITDELTKFYNHRYFQDTVSKWVKEEHYNTFALAIIDIDQFAIYNELYGHANGDRAIKRITSIINEVVPNEFMKVRFGGEEFVVVMVNLTKKQALNLSDKIRETIEEQFLLSSDIREFLTVSVGLSVYPPHGSTLNELIANANQALRLAKKSGRNKVFVYQEKDNDVVEESGVHEKIQDAFVSSIYALAATIDAKDHYTYGHSKNVALMSQLLANKLDFSDSDVNKIYNAGLLHDIGKVGIPEKVLSKPDVLTDEEYEIMKGHVVQSINIIKHIPNLIDIVPIVISHHERYDGKGYPRGIKGNNIPELGRIITIADSFDAMTTNRPYREGLSLEQAIYELKRNAGTQFDPDYVKIFIDLVQSGELNTLELVNRSNIK
ncbi:MAG: HD domain-containing phosphohydrolase [Candidatus Izemoplasma sp.]|nr:HD domain-containing phosphohydrolase [Candidatus Izemoplasma sp.]